VDRVRDEPRPPAERPDDRVGRAQLLDDSVELGRARLVGRGGELQAREVDDLVVMVEKLGEIQGGRPARALRPPGAAERNSNPLAHLRSSLERLEL
jgi:hypothetical protein